MITIRCTYPPSKLGQTSGRNWRARAALIKKWRIKWQWEFIRYKGAIEGFNTLKISFAPPDRRRRDLHNCAIAFKAGIDALADVVGVDDSKFRIIWNPDWLRPVEGGAVFIEFQSISQGAA